MRLIRTIILGVPVLIASCRQGSKKPDVSVLRQLDLKRGEIVTCGPSDKEFGVVDFKMSCNKQVENDFNVAVELLHSFEYDESEKVFAKIIDQSPECTMAYWGIAMCNFHPLWEPPSESDLRKGTKALEIAGSISGRSEREAAYLDAVGAYYKDWSSNGHPIRSINFERAMEQLHSKYPDDREAAIIYALSLVGAANPEDKSYSKQKKAGDLLNTLYAETPNHPGIIHYIIHAYDYPSIAELGLPAARRYAEVAPSSAHALHMPSHIFTRLGLWDDCIRSNTASVTAAKCYAESAGVKGHWDEELHGIDYLVYAHLQKAENKLAEEQYDYLKSISEVYPINFKDAYAFAAVPSRYFLENRLWNGAANLKIHPSSFPWEKFQWQKSIFHFTRLLGLVHIGKAVSAKLELAALKSIHDNLVKGKDLYKARQLAIQIKAGEAWIAFKSGKKEDALRLMEEAADLEDGTEKHPVTPGAVLPARELLGDLLMEMNKPKDALVAYESDLKTQPRRFNGLYGAAVASWKTNNVEKARTYFRQLTELASSAEASRPELVEARLFLKNHNAPDNSGSD
jgi:tetratricopeptide (TPR) repeat protein